MAEAEVQTSHDVPCRKKLLLFNRCYPCPVTGGLHTRCFCLNCLSGFVVTARKRSLGQGNIFAPVCHSVHGGSASVHAGIPPPQQTPPGPGTPLRSSCWEIRSTSERYASYWNAILYFGCFQKWCIDNDRERVI